MFRKIHMIVLSVFMAMFMFSGCSNGGGSSTTSTSLGGVAQKGAFIKGSKVSLCKLDSKMDCTSDKVEVTVSDDKGSYKFDALPWSGLSRLSISGNYFDEVTGKTSLSSATITAIVDIKSNIEQKNNTNILTDLSAKRMKVLVEKGKSILEAKAISQEDIKELFNISSDDFTALNLTDFSEGKASVNVELLRISAAIAKSSNPVSDLEKLMKIYNDGGLAAVLESSLYKTLMQNIEDVDVNSTLATLGVTAQDINKIPVEAVKMAPFARMSLSTMNNKEVFLTLYGTKFISASPSITLTVEGGTLSIESVTISDDNKSAILEMSESSACKDMNITATLEYMDLEGVDLPFQTNTIVFHDPLTLCNDEGEQGEVIVAPTNLSPIAIIGMDYSEEDQAEQNITAYVGQAVNGMESSYSHDRDAYPLGGITHCQWEYNGAVVKESNDTACDLYNLIFDTVGTYDYTLSVTDTDGAIDSNIAHITVLANNIPTVSISPSVNQSINVGETLELHAVASDADTADTLSLQWMYQKTGSSTQYGAGSSTQFSHQFNEVGDYNVSLTVRDSHNAQVVAYTMIHVEEDIVVPVNHTPTVRISPDGEKNLNVGDSLVLKAIAEDADGDAVSISWKIKNIKATEYTDLPLYGANGVNYTFESVGTYLLLAQVKDTNGAQSDAHITVVVSAAEIGLTLQDINLNVAVKGTEYTPNNTGDDRVVEIIEQPVHGDVSAYLVGNEVPYISYTSKDCFIGQDSFVYKSGSEYGRVNVTITSPSSLQLLSETKTLFNTETIDGEFLRAKSTSEDVAITTATHGGSSSLTVVGNEIMNYNYDPDDSFVGNDFFEYSVSETINECSYSKTGRIDFVVREYVAQKKAISTCRDPYTIGTELYKTDGTLNGTTLLKDLTTGIYTTGTAATTGFIDLDEAQKINGIQYFVANHSAGGTRAHELYETNTTTEGTFIHDLNPNNEFTGTYLYGSSNPSKFTKIDNNLFFIASDSTYDRYGMYRANGESVIRVANNVTYEPAKMGDSVYYFSSEDDNVSIYKFNDELNSSSIVDSFTKDTSGRVTTILTGIDDRILYTEYHSNFLSYVLYAKTLTSAPEKLLTYEMRSRDYFEYNSKIYFVTLNNTESSSAGGVTHIVESDGTVNGTKVVHTQNGTIQEMALLNGKLYFKAIMPVEGELYMTDINLYEFDIATGNTTFLADIAYGDTMKLGLHHGMSYMSVVDSKVVYESVNIENIDGQEKAYELLWVSDGTALGTEAILRRDRAYIGNSAQMPDLKEIFELNGAYYFQDDVGRLYTTDFTKAGTSIVLDNVCDISPDPFSFIDVNDAEFSTYYEANTTVEGISYPETKLSIEGGEYSLDNGTSWHNEATTIANGQYIKVRHISSNEYDTSVYTTLHVGNGSDTFSSRTKTETLATPNQFTFTDKTNVNVSTQQIENITVTGINVEVLLSISGGEYSLDTGSTWNTVDTNVSNNQVVYVRHTSSASNEVTVDTILNIGSISDTFSSTTKAAAVPGEDTVTVGSLMWEDIAHTRTVTQSWEIANSYCEDLTLEGYDDWRLPEFTWGGDGVEVNEFGTIMIGSRESADGDRIIHEAFVLITPNDNIAAWTNGGQNEGSHIVGFFTGGSGNFDGMFNYEQLNVRCVRDVEQ